jgi:hypothetical protein
MSLVFICHVEADKPRLKPITDRLLQLGWTLFIDRPDAMGYKFNEIKHIRRIMDGEPWRKSIDAALREAKCVVFFASRHLLDSADYRAVLKREIVVADHSGTVLPVRIDDFDFRDLPYEFRRVMENQCIDFFLPHEEGPSFDEKMERLNDAVENKNKQLRTEAFGTFERPANPVAARPTEDQIDQFVMMMDRETEALAFTQSTGVLNLVQAKEADRPLYFDQRLARIELPRQRLKPGGKTSSTTALRAELLRGLLEEQSWTTCPFVWDAGLDLTPKHNMSLIVENLIGQAEPYLRARLASDEDKDRLQLLQRNLSANNRRLLLTTYVEDHPKTRDRNSYLIEGLSELLAPLEPDRCRLVVRVRPAETPRSSTRSWLENLSASAKTATLIVLNQIKRGHMQPWCDLMSLFLDGPALRMTDHIEEIFNQERGRQIAFRDLENKVRPIIQAWPLKPFDRLALTKTERT